MAAIKPLEQSGDKWNRRSSVAGPDYVQGVTNPRTSWATAAQAANQNYVQGVTQAANAGRYGAGVRKAGDQAWQQAATQKGPGRFAEGVSLAVGKWQQGFQPYQATIASVQLSARGPTGSEQNYTRSTAIGRANRATKLRLIGGTAAA